MPTTKDKAQKIVQALQGEPALMAEVQALLRSPPSGNWTHQHNVEVSRAVEDFRTRQGLRLDWHEPDEREVTAKVIGTGFDNAMGNSVDQDALNGGYQEMVVEITAGDGASAQDRLRVNLATLFAIAAAYGRLVED